MPAFTSAVLATAIPLIFFQSLKHTISKPGVFLWIFLLAFSSPIGFYSSQVKQYATEVAFAVLTICLFVHLTQRVSSWTRWLLFTVVGVVGCMTLYTPIILFSSTFIGCSYVVLLSGKSEKRLHSKALWLNVCSHATIFVAFAVAYFGYLRLDLPGDAVVVAYWQEGFWDGSARFAVTSTLHWVGHALNLTPQFLLIAGVSVLFWVGKDFSSTWQRHSSVVLICILPILIALCVSALHLYPYGEVRLMLYAAPGVLFLCAIGAAEVLISSIGRLAAPLWGLILLLFLNNGIVNDTYNSSYMRNYDLQFVYDYISLNHKGDEPIVISGILAAPLVYYYPELMPFVLEEEDLRSSSVDALTLESEYWIVRWTTTDPMLGNPEGTRVTDVRLEFRDIGVYPGFPKTFC